MSQGIPERPEVTAEVERMKMLDRNLPLNKMERLITAKHMNFSDALLAIKAGSAVSRRNMDGFISMTAGARVPSDKIWSPHNKRVAQEIERLGREQIWVAPSITRCQPNGGAMIVMGWQPTQEDMFAEDWVVCV